jgi:Raf kinase inhibitor-like YbhB/YbcL family protein
MQHVRGPDASRSHRLDILEKRMRLVSSCFEDGGMIPARCAFCAPDPQSHVTLSSNLNPDLAWFDLPVGTRSLVLVCHDPDVPSKPDDVNEEGRVIAADTTRVDFFHWIVVDIDPASGRIGEGEFSSEVTPKGKGGPTGPHGTRQGINDYSVWFAADQDMAGAYYGYDGPCPPWNDSIVHRYVFTLHALDVEHCPVQGSFKGPYVLRAIQGHVLGSATLTGRYTVNPSAVG